ncbi:MAG: T9SS type A sorting domain-containing protein [Bacteroidales bacterium]|nr:T9SS type A sorting domain-containing protein [Bacteroidales bacterium]
MTNIDYEEPVYLEVYNNVGVRIYDKTLITQSNSSINLSRYPPGLYIFKVQYPDRIELKKGIKF